MYVCKNGLYPNEPLHPLSLAAGPATGRSGDSTSDSVEPPRPHDPKWEGYLITSLKDPVKELAETKDAYVSYLVSAKVCLLSCARGCDTD